MRMFLRYMVGIALTACLLIWPAMPTIGQSGAKNGEWRTYGADLGNTHYSPLEQINADNFYKLQVAWRFKTDNLGPAPEFNLESTPLMVNGVVYSTAGTRRAVVAMDAATGELLWTHGEHEGPRGEAAPRSPDNAAIFHTPSRPVAAPCRCTAQEGGLQREDSQVMTLVWSPTRNSWGRG